MATTTTLTGILAGAEGVGAWQAPRRSIAPENSMYRFFIRKKD
jgi:hypothetical protein